MKTLQESRETLGISQRAFAALLGLSQGTISNIERGQRQSAVPRSLELFANAQATAALVNGAKAKGKRQAGWCPAKEADLGNWYDASANEFLEHLMVCEACLLRAMQLARGA